MTNKYPKCCSIIYILRVLHQLTSYTVKYQINFKTPFGRHNNLDYSISVENLLQMVDDVIST